MQQKFPNEKAGIFLLNKGLNLSSNQAMQIVRKIFDAPKAGHTGALDVLASGMLPICLGQATKFAGYLLNADKSYTVELCLGIRTASGDKDSEVLETRELEEYTTYELQEKLNLFIGRIKQVPPMHSALKKNGKPLYKLARKGVSVAREAREIEVYNIDLLEYKKPVVKISVSCSKGTYIRTLVDDFGQELGVGAHVSMLHRDTVYKYSNSDMLTIAELDTLTKQEKLAKILPIESMLLDKPIYHISDYELEELRHGRPVFVSTGTSSGIYRLRSPEEAFLGLIEVKQDLRVRSICLLKQPETSNIFS